MKTRQLILATATALLAASPLLAVAGDGEGSMWTDLLVLREQLAATPSAMAAEVGPRRIYQNLYEEQAARQTQSAAGMAGRPGPAMDARSSQPRAAGARVDRPDTRGEVSLYEQIAERQRSGAGA